MVGVGVLLAALGWHVQQLTVLARVERADR